MQKEKIAAIGLVIIIIVVLSTFLAFTYVDQLSEIFSGGKDASLKAVNDNIPVGINVKNKTINYLENDKYSDIENLSTTIVVKPSHGTAEVSQNEIFYTPNDNYTGPDSFKYKLTNSKGKSSEATVTIEISYGVIEIGDCVDVYYIGKFTNGTVFDTNIEKVANQSKIFNETKKLLGFYNISKVFVDPESLNSPPEGYENYSAGLIKGFLNGLIGMKQGETKNVTIDPENAYGIWNLSYAEDIFTSYYGTPYLPRKEGPSPISVTISKSDFTQINSSVNVSDVTVNQTFDVGTGYSANGSIVIWKIQITNISDENITIKNIIPNGTILKTEGMWDMVVIIENETTYSVRNDPDLKTIYGGPGFWIKVISLDDEKIIFAINDGYTSDTRLIGETLIFQLTAVKVYKTSELLES
jgi:hypothetical protein